MLFHEALHLVFATFSRQVLQQGRLTAYLADCGVFDTFDDRRTICLTIDHHYGVRLYNCLSHSPYKQQFDAILAEVKQLHPTIDPQQVDYVFQSIRFAWGKIKSVRPPQAPNPFPIAKRPKARRPASTPYTLHPTPHPKAKRPASTPYTLHPTPHPKAKRPASTPYTLHPTPHPKAKRPIAKRPSSPPFRAGVGGRLAPAQRQKRNGRVILYLFALIFAFCSCVLLNSNHGDMGSLCLLFAGICTYVIYKYLK